jgi:hypothetical protein
MSTPGDINNAALDSAIERLENAIKGGHLEDVMVAQIELGVTALGSLSLEAAERVTVSVDALAKIASLASTGHIDTPTVKFAAGQYRAAIAKVGDGLIDGADRARVEFAQSMLHAGGEIAIGIVTAGLGIVAPAIGAGVAAALAGLRAAQ